MSNRKAILRHGLTTMMTTLSILNAESGLKPEEKEKMGDWVRLVSMLLNYEKIFLGQKQKIFKKKTNLTELLQILCGVFANRWGNIAWELPQTSLMVLADRNTLADALELMLKKYAKKKVCLNLAIEPDKNQLVLKFKSNNEKGPKCEDLLGCLQKGVGNPEWGYQLSLRLLELNGIKVDQSESKIILKFPRRAV